jgi:Holliday junction resolvase
MNKAYQKGRRAEYKVMHALRAGGWECFRTAGSHGRFDVIAYHKELKKIKFIQVKHYKVKKANKFILKGKFAVSEELWHL